MKSIPVSKHTIYEIKDAEGHLVATHHRVDKKDGTKQVWWGKDGAKRLNGTPLADLPLYGSELMGDYPQDELIVLVEGEKARDALKAVGIPAVGTVTGANSNADQALALEREMHDEDVLSAGDARGEGGSSWETRPSPWQALVAHE